MDVLVSDDVDTFVHWTTESGSWHGKFGMILGFCRACLLDRDGLNIEAGGFVVT